MSKDLLCNSAVFCSIFDILFLRYSRFKALYALAFYVARAILPVDGLNNSKFWRISDRLHLHSILTETCYGHRRFFQ